MSKYRYIMAVAVAAALYSFSAAVVEAKTFNVKSTSSGTGTSVPVDISGDSCTVVNMVEVCTATSSLATYAGKSSGGPLSGQFTGQAISQTMPVAGAGCSFAPTTIAACTIGSNTAGCSYSFVGGAGASRFSSNGDLLAFIITGGSVCLDATTGAVEGAETVVGAGGSGKAAGTTGAYISTFRGQFLLNDPAGNGFNWYTSSYTGTLTK